MGRVHVMQVFIVNKVETAPAVLGRVATFQLMRQANKRKADAAAKPSIRTH